MTQSRKDYARLVKLAAWASLITAGLLIISKLYGWALTGSASLMAALTDSLLDAVASGMNFFVLRYALMPADDEHRFGHGKAESLAGLGQAAFISGSSVLLIFHAVHRIYQPVPLQQAEVGIWVALFSIVVTLLLVSFQNYVVKHTGSMAIKADSLHYKGDILLNATVLFAIVLTAQGFTQIDSVAGILIALYLLYNAWGIALESANNLMDRELSCEEQQKVKDLALANPQVRGIHRLRTRQSGSTKFVQMHLSLDDELTLVAAHQIADEVELSIKQAFGEVDVIIHQDPLSAGEPDDRDLIN